MIEMDYILVNYVSQEMVKRIFLIKSAKEIKWMKIKATDVMSSGANSAYDEVGINNIFFIETRKDFINVKPIFSH